MTYISGSLLLLSVFLYITTSVTFSQSRPFRTRIYKNKIFFVTLVALYVFNTIVLFFPPLELLNFALIRVIPDVDLKLYIFTMAVAHLLLSVGFEMFVVERPALWEWLRGGARKARHQRLLDELVGGGTSTAVERSDLQVPDPTLRINTSIESSVSVLEMNDDDGSSSSVQSVEQQCSQLHASTTFSLDKFDE